MSIFRPLNSSESNLFTIRVSLGTLSSNLTGDEIFIDNDSTLSNTTYLLSPSIKCLPTNFKIEWNDINKRFNIEYGKTFTSRPTISLSFHYNDILKSTNVQFYIEHHNLTVGSTNAYLYIINSTTSDALVPGTTSGLIGFDIIITGPVRLGVTTGNSNKGWAVSAGNDATDVYTYMNVGIGTGDPSIPLHVAGAASFRMPILTDQPTDLTLTSVYSGYTILQTTVGKNFTLPVATGSGVWYKFLWAGPVQTNIIAMKIITLSSQTIIGSVDVNNTITSLGTKGAGTMNADLSIGSTSGETHIGDYITIMDGIENKWYIIDSCINFHTYAT